ncbi:iron-sulfur cluster co-chaperone protein HscB-like [Hoplias malabaricus]|uniref:iron-sulfur cluster co-chaperone protein HscB-like n=1 Tax=Hoplias malabaricus TaxID=27720 RepID=UPI0034630D0C
MNCVRTLCVFHRIHKRVRHIQNVAVSFCFAAGNSVICTTTPPRLTRVESKRRARFTVGLRRSLSLSPSERRCWRCGSVSDLFFCSGCGVIQPPEERATYFQILNCDQIFALDIQKLQRRYLELQRSLHPDNFSRKSSTEQGYSEKQSALVNKAFRTLQKPLTRAVYMLQLCGVELEEGADATADPSFLLEIMDVNEKLAESQSTEEVNAIGQAVQETLKDLTEQMNTLLNKEDLQSAKEILARMKYFTNVEEKVKDKLTKNL